MVPDTPERSVQGGIRINDLCRELGVKPKLVIDYLPEIGITERKTHSSEISQLAADKIRLHFRHTLQTNETTIDAKSLISEEEATFLAPTDERVGLSQAETASNRPKEKQVTSPEPFVLRLPAKFTFYRGFVDFDFIFSYFDWTLKDTSVLVDLTGCQASNFQALVLLIQYLWALTINRCRVTFKLGVANSGPTKMLTNMGALDWFQVLTTDGKNFGNRPGRTLALRRRSDVQNAINIARRAIQTYSVGFPDYLSYIVSELLYNATEHGCRQTLVHQCNVAVPSIFQFGRYPASERLAFFFSDIGVGIKAHLERAYPSFPTHQDAIVYALRPNVSGTFNQQSSPYMVTNNAGMGLTYSSLMLKRLKADMYIVSHSGLAHVSPQDVTTRSLKYSWPGTFVLVDLNISNAPRVSLEDLLREIRVKAETEVAEKEKQEEASRLYVNMQNFFGKWAEDKDAAISFRDRRLIPAILQGKRIDLDFQGVETAPHSFLNALLATPVQRLGVKAYQKIRVFNASGPIHEIIHLIFETNVPKLD